MFSQVDLGILEDALGDRIGLLKKQMIEQKDAQLISVYREWISRTEELRCRIIEQMNNAE